MKFNAQEAVAANEDDIEFKTYDAVCAKEAVATDIELVWLLVTTLFPFNERDPVIETDPVNT
jgi:hypothetical protein